MLLGSNALGQFGLDSNLEYRGTIHYGDAAAIDAPLAFPYTVNSLAVRAGRSFLPSFFSRSEQTNGGPGTSVAGVSFQKDFP